MTLDIVGRYIQMTDELETVYVGQGFHYIQEDQPDAIGRALFDWIGEKSIKDMTVRVCVDTGLA